MGRCTDMKRSQKRYPDVNIGEKWITSVLHMSTQSVTLKTTSKSQIGEASSDLSIYRYLRIIIEVNARSYAQSGHS